MTVEVRAVHKNAHISAQKVRTVANAVRGLPVARALAALSLSPKKAARVIEKVLKSAVANAEQNNALDVDSLQVSTIQIDQGEVLKRYRPKGMGRMRQRFHRHSHVVVAVSERGS